MVYDGTGKFGSKGGFGSAATNFGFVRCKVAWWRPDDWLPGRPGAGGPTSFGADGPIARRGLGVIQRALGFAPTLEDEVTVEVTGQPGTTKQQLYFLALATANGIVRRFAELFPATTPAFGTLVIEYDSASHWVRCTIGYSWSMVALNADTGVVIGTQFEKMAVYRGPQCDVVGGDFDFISGVLPVPVGIPASAVSPDAPQLPLAGQPILTACPTTPTPIPKAITQNPAPSVPIVGPGIVIQSPNPKPPGDNRSRGAVIVPTTGPGGVPISSPFNLVPGPTPTAAGAKCCDKLRALIPLVYAALSSPATDADMRYAPPTAGPTGG